jgi:alcohol dehydrogenase class IV
MNYSFIYDVIPGRVVFGAGSRRSLREEASQLGSERVLVIASPEEDALAEDVQSILGDLVVGRFSDVVQHVPVSKAREAILAVREGRADTIVTVGGGSATGFGKAISLETEVKSIALPTTYAGSEMTTIWGLTDGDRKQTGKDPRVKPDLVVYDPELTLTLPPEIAGPSGMNAMAHSVEALYGPGANPVISAMAIESIRALYVGLPRVTSAPDDLQGRTEVLYGAYLAGVALATGGTALHHKTCHVLGGMFNLNHGDMNAVLLGHVLAYNAPAIPDQMEAIGTALELKDVPVGLFELSKSIGAPTSLEAIGMPASGIGAAVDRLVVEAAANVRPLEKESVRKMLEDAYSGCTPRSHIQHVD